MMLKKEYSRQEDYKKAEGFTDHLQTGNRLSNGMKCKPIGRFQEESDFWKSKQVAIPSRSNP